MGTPFPGMDPYLEHPSLWPDVHNSLIAALRDELGPQLRPRYVVRLEERTYVQEPEGMVFIGRPDVAMRTAEPAPVEPPSDSEAPSQAGVLTVEVPAPDRVRETWIQVRAVDTGEVVTVLELLSPTNKIPGEGKRMYEHKRSEVLMTRTHLVEVDLCRAGEPPPIRRAAYLGDYRILVARGGRRPWGELRPFTVREAIPRFPLPLREGDLEPEVDLGSILQQTYERASYDLSIDYSQEPLPPLGEEDRAWTDTLLRRAGLRR